MGWLDQTDWRKRSSGFGELRIEEALYPPWKMVQMELGGPDSGVVVDSNLWHWWHQLSNTSSGQPYLTILEVAEPRWLRYAAIDWDYTPVKLGSNTTHHAKVAGYALATTHALEYVVKKIGLTHAGWFACPIAKLTFDGELRLAFATSGRALPEDHCPPEMPPDGTCGEGALVYAVGRVVRQLIADDPDTIGGPLGSILRRCLSASPETRFPSLATLAVALRKAGAPKRVRDNLRAADTRGAMITHGLGLTNARSWKEAQLCFEIGARQWGDYAFRTLARQLDEYLERRESTLRNLKPLVLQESPLPTKPAGPPARVPTQQELVERALYARQFATALTHADAWLATYPDEPRAHHVRGKALLSLGRLVDARTAFDRACTLRPQMLEAMLLRGEVDRTIAKLRAVVGTANPMQLALPAHLGELRDGLISGRVADAIAMLQRADYAADAVAQLLLGELLSAELRHDEALAVYAKVGTHEAALGRARVLIALARPTEALDVLDALTVARPDLDEVLDVRARALIALERTAEAEAAHAAYMQAIARRSDRRVHSR